MAGTALEVLALNEVTPQIRAPGVGDTYTMPRALTVTGSITIAGGTVPASIPVLNATQTWNSGTAAFTGIKLNITNTASAEGSKLLDLQVGGASKFSVDKSGVIQAPALTVATLPAAATAGAGARSFVTDANATTFLSTVAGGGANKVPVVSDGTNWLIG